MATFEIHTTDADIIGTGSDDLIYNDVGDNGIAPGAGPDGLTVDGRGGIDTVDFATYDDGAYLMTGLNALYNSSTGIATFTYPGNAQSTFTSIEKMVFENGTLDLTDPAAIAGQYFVGTDTYKTIASGDTTTSFGTVADVYVTAPTATAGEFDVVTVTDGGVWVYTAINGEAISTGGVQLAQGTFTIDDNLTVGNLTDDTLAFVAKQSYLDGLGAEGDSFTVEVTLADQADPTNTVTSTYTITVEGSTSTSAPFAFTAGNDTFAAYTASGPDITGATDANGVMDALAGDDFVSGASGADNIFGGAGNDQIYAGNGGMTTGNDVFAGGAGDDRIAGGDGDDLLIGDSTDEFVGTTVVYGDLLADDSGNDVIYGGDGADTIYTGSWDGATHTGNGTDEAWGGNGGDMIYGDNGADKLAGGAGSDTINGGGGNDVIYSGADAASTDDLLGGAGNDTIYGGDGVDNIDGGTGNDVLYGGSGIDTVEGGSGADSIFGGADGDYLYGDAGDDIITGGAGDGASDDLTGGDGADTFVFSAGDGADLILDFSQGEGDLIDLSALGITSFAEVDANAYQIGTNTTIELDAGATAITLNGVAIADLSAADFIFA